MSGHSRLVSAYSMAPGRESPAPWWISGNPSSADAKLHDIPSQVEAAARQLGRLGVRWVTAHVAGGEAMLRVASEALGDTSGGYAGVLGVTVLTSLGDDDLASVGIASTPGKLVSKMARLAETSGCEGVVCSPQELTVVGQVAPRPGESHTWRASRGSCDQRPASSHDPGGHGRTGRRLARDRAPDHCG